VRSQRVHGKASSKNFLQSLNRRFRQIPFWVIGVVIGVVCLVTGYFDGQLEDIYRKAIMICLECIGIG